MNPATDSPLSLARALAEATRAGLARMDAQMLLLHLMGQDSHARAWLIAHDDQLLSSEQHQRWDELVRQRLRGMPVAYLTGGKDFYGLRLQVDARVLDPRPDTETLVDWALELIPANTPCHAADLGTGSGAIALALKSQRPHAEIWAVDASADALAVARANALRLGLPVQFAQGDWLEPLAGQGFDLIASNPPYIRADDPHLAALRHEPLPALASGADGLDDIRRIARQAPACLRAGGWLLLEHGWDQAEDVARILGAAGFTGIAHRQDLAGITRCTGGRLPT